MRLWSIHPSYLDAKGLVALWREALLAQQVLLGKTKGYQHHPQLHRFKNASDAEMAIGHYLWHVALAADERGYRFNKEKIVTRAACPSMSVTQGQLDYEWQHLLAKLKVRDQSRYAQLKPIKTVNTHPSFVAVDGAIESWEVVG